jgi:hypothetical protein
MPKSLRGQILFSGNPVPAPAPRVRQARQIAARLCQRTTLILFHEAFMLAPTKT